MAVAAAWAAVGTPTGPGPRTPLSERTQDSFSGIPATVGSAWPPEPPRTVFAERGPVDPEIPGPLSRGTDSGPVSLAAMDSGPLAAVSCDLTTYSVVTETEGTSSGSTSPSLHTSASLIALERVNCAIMTDYENGSNNVTSLLHQTMAAFLRNANRLQQIRYNKSTQI